MQQVIYRRRPAVDRALFVVISLAILTALIVAALYAGANRSTVGQAAQEPTIILAPQGPNDQDALGQLARPEFLTDQDALGAMPAQTRP